MTEHLLVEAGAGCGKTYGLVARYLRGLGIEIGTGATIRNVQALDPGQILAVTFTEDAAREMEERILKELARRPENAALRERVMSESRIGTFHGLCLRLLKPHLKALGYDAEAGLVSSPAAQHLRRRHLLRELARREEGRCLVEVLPPRTIADLGVNDWFTVPAPLGREGLRDFQETRTRIEAFRARTSLAARSAWSEYGAKAKPAQAEGSWLRHYMRLLETDDPTAAASMNFQTGPKGLELATEARAYRDFVLDGWAESLRPEALEEELRVQNSVFDFLRQATAAGPKVLDFDALESEVLGLLRRGQRLVAPPRLVLVDEFQDTNGAQFEILSRLADDTTETYFVGDPKQSIYSFRGADVGVFLNLKHSGKLTLAPLSTNYRSEAAALHFMNLVQGKLFDGDRAGDPESQALLAAEAHRERASLRPAVEIQELPPKASLGDAVAQAYRERVELLGPRSTHAALFRSWKTLYATAMELREAGLPVRISGSEKILEHPLTELFASTLEWLDNPGATEGLTSLHRWLGPTPWTGEKPDAATEQRYRSLLDFDGWTEALDAFALLLRPSRWPDGGLWLTALRPLLEELSRAGWELQFTRAELGRFVRGRAGSFDTEVLHALDRVEGQALGPALELLTIHGAKGLEWDAVYLPELYERGRGSTESSAEAENESAVRLRLRDARGRTRLSVFFERTRRRREIVVEAEARRLFYVAITRAVKGIWIGLHPPGRSTESPLLDLLGWPSKNVTPWNRVLCELRAEGAFDPLISSGALCWSEAEATTEAETAEESPSRNTVWQLPDPPPLANSREIFFREGVSRYLRRHASPEDAPSWARRRATPESQDARRNAASLGEEIHSWLEVWNGSTEGLESLAPPLSLRATLLAVRTLPELQGFWEAAARDDGSVQREFGLFVNGPDFRLSGFADALWFNRDEIVIVDWKTSRSLKSLSDKRRREGIRRQLALYAEAFRDQGLPVRGLAIGIEASDDSENSPRVRVVLDEVL